MMCYVLLPGHQRQCHSSGGLENKGSEECLCNYKRLFIRSLMPQCGGAAMFKKVYSKIKTGNDR